MSDQKELWDLLDDFAFCMATTHDGESMRSRPMSPRVDKDAGVIRFLVENATPMTDQLEQDHDILLAFIAPKDRNFISISGTAAISQDRGLIKELWNKAADAWFVGGPDGANVAAVVVTPSYAEFWDGTSSTLQIQRPLRRGTRGGAFSSVDEFDLQRAVWWGLPAESRD